MVHFVGKGIIRNWFAQRRPRGAAVPFEAPALRMARVCDDERDGLIAVLRDFANNGTSYIVPWTSLPLMVSMTAHDIALHEAVGEDKASTPAQVRAVISKLALSGVLGPEAKARESEHIRTGQGKVADVELMLLLHLLASNGAELESLAADPAGSRDAAAKAAVIAAESAVGVRRQRIYERIAEFNQLLAPVGLVAGEGAVLSGWLRVLHDEIVDFSESAALSVQRVVPEAGVQLDAIAKTARRTAQLSGMVLGMIDYAVLDIAGTIRRWNIELPVLRQAIDRLSLILDEWPALMKGVHDALRDPPEAMVEALRLMRSVLPLVPETEQPVGDRAPGGDADATSVSRILAARLSAIWSMLHPSGSVEAWQ